MNLAIEYLVRSGAIRNLFKVPSTLALSNPDEARLWVTFKTEDDRIAVSTWNLSLPLSDRLPVCDSRSLGREELFHPGLVCPEGFRPVRYIEEPTPSGLNTYNKPMPKDHYDRYWSQAVNTVAHQRFKYGWLWDSFARLVGMSSRYRSYMDMYDAQELWQICQEEESWLSMTDRSLYKVWTEWVDHLHINNPDGAANELVFLEEKSPQQTVGFFLWFALIGYEQQTLERNHEGARNPAP